VAARADTASLGRLRHAVDFERVLKTRSRARSVHFAAHHVAAEPARRCTQAKPALNSHLSTELCISSASPVDMQVRPSSFTDVSNLPQQRWLGVLVPKRHARRAVTRSLLKRQIRAVFSAPAAGLCGGLWVVRLRAGFDRQLFRSPASVELSRAARGELEELLRSCSPADPSRR
jgi:ribonuclease P protein component